MCIVSGKAKLNNTNILVLPDSTGTVQMTVYQNSVNNMSLNNAMILPVLIPESVELIDLSGYKNIFEDCKKSFGHIYESESFSRGSIVKKTKNYIPIKKSGSYLASVCCSHDDIKRIDPKLFKISDDCEKFLKLHYPEPCWGFIVCRLDDTREKYEPFAYKNAMVDNKLFVPTRHFHGHHYTGSLYSVADDWDHNIYTYDSYGQSWPGHESQHNILFLDLKKLDIKVRPNGIFRRYFISGHAENKDLIAFVPIMNK